MMSAMTKRATVYARSAFAIALIALVARAEATVTQVDGTIIPQGTVSATNLKLRMQDALDTYEPGPPGSIDAIKDAS